MKLVNLDASIDSLEVAARGIMAEVDRLRKQNAALVQALQDILDCGSIKTAERIAEKALSDSKAGGQ